MSRVEYTGRKQGNYYRVMSESFGVCELSVMRRISKQYPKIRNIYYKWDCCNGSEHPSFVVKDSITVINDIWKHIIKIDSGVYLIAADTPRLLKIYRQRWLTTKNDFNVLETGIVNACPYVVVRKLDIVT